MAKMGRPSISINWEDFEKLCALHCTLEELASWFNCSADTIERHVKKQYGSTFAEVYKQKSPKGNISLRRKMYETAMNGNVTMMIWLSKQMLGYSDKSEEKIRAEVIAISPEKAREEIRQVLQDPQALALAKQFQDRVKPKNADPRRLEAIARPDGSTPDSGKV